jgi:hypothetical protein
MPPKNEARDTRSPAPKPQAKLSRRSTLDAPRNSFVALSEELAAKINSDLIVEKTSQDITKSELQEFLRATIRDCIATVSPHRTWIAEIDRLAFNAKDLSELKGSIRSYLRQAGITRIDEFATDEPRFIVTESKLVREGPAQATQPAYIDTASGRTILAGRAHRAAKSQSQQVPNRDID